MRAPRRRALVALACGLALTAACSAALRHPTPEDAALVAPRWPGTTLADLQRGRTLYVRRCSGCHNLYLPRAYAPERWPRLVDRMAEKARLGPREQEDVTRFLVAVASEGPAAR
jgi:cytochrome c5